MLNVVSFIVLSMFFSFVYFVTIKLQPYRLHWLIKGCSISFLAAFAFFNFPNSIALVFTAALVFSSVGDIFLAYSEEKYFVHGLVSFLLSHIIYSFIFIKYAGNISENFWQKLILVITISIYFVVMLRVLYKRLGNLKIPVFIYMGVLACMVIGSIFVINFNYILIIGAFLFAISDSILAIQKFVKTIKGSAYMIWASYYLAQLFICYGMLLALIH
ncbi:lysoplasmalogenase [Fluviispira vulneris]|uniref:lysoplasmalogenase n=1 Tax=Fluviispira vulneris TaxID=2763012 RepID=UPI0016469C4D|nr:lysoplasmalogenase [Fluviispira vulneris]